MQNCKLCGEPYEDDMIWCEGFCSYECFEEADDINMKELEEPSDD